MLLKKFLLLIIFTSFSIILLAADVDITKYGAVGDPSRYLLIPPRKYDNTLSATLTKYFDTKRADLNAASFYNVIASAFSSFVYQQQHFVILSLSSLTCTVYFYIDRLIIS